jgi:hypothetical protein
MTEKGIKQSFAAVSGNWAHVLVVFCAISTGCILGWLLKYSSYGFDFTDESFYLVWMANPFDYKWVFTQFGFVYHPLYQFLNGNIAALRQVNIFLTFGLATVMVIRFIKVIVPESPPNKLQRWVISLSFATTSLVMFDSWLLTPSYNSLALQSMFIATTGLLMAEATPSGSSLGGWILIGFGGWLAFMAKPTTAVALGVCATVYLIGTRKFKLRWLMISIGVSIGLLCVTALVIDGSLVNYVNRLKTGVQFAQLAEGGYTFRQILRLDRFRLNGAEMFLLTSMGLFSFLAAWLYDSGRRWGKRVGRAISGGFFLCILAILFGGLVLSFGFGRFHSLTLWAIPLSAIGLGIASCGRGLFRNVPINQRALALLFVIFPHVYAFGSNNNYFHRGSSASLFWVLAGLVFVGPFVRNQKRWVVFLPLALATQLIVVLLLQVGFKDPYRQMGPISMNENAVEVGQQGSSLFLSEEYAAYVKKTVESARNAGFEEGAPVIDLSGQSPGILYIMRAENIGQPWTIGGYPGSFTLAVEALRLVPCEKIAKAWLMAEPGGPRSLPSELLENFGANFSDHFEQVVSWETPRGVGGYEERPPLLLLKPKRTIVPAVQACFDKKLKPNHGDKVVE